MTAQSPTIFATCAGLGPGAWLDASYSPIMRYAVDLAQVTGRTPRVLHVNTAGGDQRTPEGDEVAAGRAAGVEVSHLRLFPHPNVPDLRGAVLDSDVVWVGGGSVANLLAVWRVHGLDSVFREAWQSGVVLAGISAGALCWHSSGSTSSFGPGIGIFTNGLGFLPHSLGVHYDSDGNRPVQHERAIAEGELPAGFALDEGVGIVYRGTEVTEVVAQSSGNAYWIEREGNGVAKRTITPRRLPGV